jgi:hypothetical protein
MDMKAKRTRRETQVSERPQYPRWSELEGSEQGRRWFLRQLGATVLGAGLLSACGGRSIPFEGDESDAGPPAIPKEVPPDNYGGVAPYEPDVGPPRKPDAEPGPHYAGGARPETDAASCPATDAGPPQPYPGEAPPEPAYLDAGRTKPDSAPEFWGGDVAQERSWSDGGVLEGGASRGKPGR